MAVSHSTHLENGILDGSSPVKTAFNGGSCAIQDGTAPANANAARTGTTGVSVSLPSPLFGTPVGGQLTANTISAATITASITATYGRLQAVGDDGAAVTTTEDRIQFTVGTAGTDMVLNTTSLVAGGTFTITSLTYKIPA